MPKRHNRLTEGSVAYLLLDILASHNGMWFTREDIQTVALDIRPDLNPKAIDRAFFRVRHMPGVKYRMVDDGPKRKRYQLAQLMTPHRHFYWEEPAA